MIILAASNINWCKQVHGNYKLTRPSYGSNTILFSAGFGTAYRILEVWIDFNKNCFEDRRNGIRIIFQ
jgi:hypothetical protein